MMRIGREGGRLGSQPIHPTPRARFCFDGLESNTRFEVGLPSFSLVWRGKAAQTLVSVTGGKTADDGVVTAGPTESKKALDESENRRMIGRLPWNNPPV